MEKVPGLLSIPGVPSSRTQETPALSSRSFHHTASEAEVRVLKAAMSWFRHSLREDSLKPYEVALFEAVADLRLEAAKAPPPSIEVISANSASLVPSTLRGLGEPVPEIELPDEDDGQKTVPILEAVLEELLKESYRTTMYPQK